MLLNKPFCRQISLRSQTLLTIKSITNLNVCNESFTWVRYRYTFNYI